MIAIELHRCNWKVPAFLLLWSNY